MKTKAKPTKRRTNPSVAAQLLLESTLERIMGGQIPDDHDQLCHDIWSSGLGVRKMKRLALLFEQIAVAVGGEQYEGMSVDECENCGCHAHLPKRCDTCDCLGSF